MSSPRVSTSCCVTGWSMPVGRVRRRPEPLHGIAQIPRGDRLRDELVKARGLRACDLLREDRCAEGDDRHAQAAGAKASTDRKAVLLRELYVEEDEVELIGGALFAGRAVPLGHDLVAVSLERRLEELDIHRIVLNEENAQAVSFPWSAPSRPFAS